jgi:quinol monooxygenase YgiN
MSGDIHWIVEFNVKHGKRRGLVSIVSEIVAATKANEPGTKSYEWYINGDGKQAHVCERYASSAAALKHLKTFGENFADRLLATVNHAHGGLRRSKQRGESRGGRLRGGPHGANRRLRALSPRAISGSNRRHAPNSVHIARCG